MPLSRDQILAAGPREIITLSVPEFGGEVCLRPLSGAEATEIYKLELDQARLIQAIVVASICDQDGGRMFTPDDVPALFDKPNSALQAIMRKALEINRMTKEAVDSARKD